MKNTALLGLTLGLFASTACVAEEPVLDDAEVLTALASATTTDGEVWNFYEGEPGEIIVHAIAEEEESAFQKLDHEEMAYTELFEELAGTSAPNALVEAQHRYDTIVLSPDASDAATDQNEIGGEMPPDDGIGRQRQEISATGYQDSYCSGFWDYSYCWPSFYGSPYVQRKTYSMYGFVGAVNNTVNFRMRRKSRSWSSWSTVLSGQALPGQVHHVYSKYFGRRQLRRWEVTGNGGNLVRFSVYGSD